MANLKNTTVGSTSDTSPSLYTTSNLIMNGGGELKIQNGKILNTSTTFNLASSGTYSSSNKVYFFPNVSQINLFQGELLQNFEIKSGNTEIAQISINNENNTSSIKRVTSIGFQSQTGVYTNPFNGIQVPTYGKKNSIEMITNPYGNPFLRFNAYNGSSIKTIDIEYDKVWLYQPLDGLTLDIQKDLLINTTNATYIDDTSSNFLQTSTSRTTSIPGVFKIVNGIDWYAYNSNNIQDGSISIVQNTNSGLDSDGGVAIVSHLYNNSKWILYVGDQDGYFSYKKGFFGFRFVKGSSPYSTSKTVVAYINPDAVFGSLNFTGQHRNKTKNSIENYMDKIGLIVVSTGKYSNLENKKNTIDESLPVVDLSNKQKQKSVFGVISDCEDPDSNERSYNIGSWGFVMDKDGEGDSRLYINSVGEGGIWVTNINGNLENGDYITTCEIPGYGMKQDSEFLHNYTVAKITCDCDFNLESPIYICEEFEHEGTMYKRAFVGCTYHCG